MTLSVASLIIKLNRVQREVVKVQGEVVAWNGTQTQGAVKTAESQVAKLLEKVEAVRDDFDQSANAAESATHDPTFETIMQSLLNLTTVINDASLSLSKNHTFKFDKLKLPTFSGEFSEWQEFADLFKSAVHTNGAFPGGAKMVYLKEALQGDAASIIANSPSTALGYDEAWKKVEARYSNKREIVFSHLRKFYQLKLQQDSSSGIRKLCDTVNECVRSLTILQIAVDQRDVILVFLSLTKLDEETKKQWLLTQGNDLPKLSELLDYLEKRATALSESPKLSSKSKSTPFASSHHVASTGQGKSTCLHCNKNHPIYFCSEFKGLSVSDRIKVVAEKKACPNCLSPTHQYTKDCKSEFKCKNCGKTHHTLLHYEKKGVSNTQQKSQSKGQSKGSGAAEGESQVPMVQPSSSTSSSIPEVGGNHASIPSTNSVVLLATLIVNVSDNQGKLHSCRVFLDPGSEANFVSENLVSRLSLQRQKTCVKVTGIGGSNGDKAKGIVKFSAVSKTTHFSLPVQALILPKLTGNLPREKCSDDFPHLRGLTLSDPKFFSPSSVDILLGAEAAAQILLPGLKRGPPGTPLAQNSQFGWFLSGSAPSSVPRRSWHCQALHSTCAVNDECLQSSLQRFWELEDPSPPSSQDSSEDVLCENYFLQTFHRDPEGRYEVSLPFSPNSGDLGESRSRAISCFKSLEKQIQKDPKLMEAYHSQIENYLEKGWVEQVPPAERSNSLQLPITTTGETKLSLSPHYIPHHVVVKPDNTTTQVRIVFNASAKTTSGNSLNSVLLSGPKIQTDLHPLLTRFRSHPIALSADIVKFYHQVKVSPLHTDFQRFLWRKSPNDPFMDLRFLRLLFGVTSAPYLAIRVLRQLGEENKEKFPLAHNSIVHDFLVDNLLSGAATLEEAMELKGQLTEVLTQGHFPLQKWASNHQQVLSSIDPGERDTFSLDIQEDDSVKTIGLFWHPASDSFGVKISNPPSSSTPTKREVLSRTARVFDPLKWLAPVTIAPKILLQSLWKEKLGWDDPIPIPILRRWNKYCSELELLRQFRVPRCLTYSTPHSSQTQHEIIGFCDASNLAYAACVYLRSRLMGETKVELVAAKTKVAPVQGETTPRMELCSAVLLSHLVNSTVAALLPTKIQIESVSCFTDSTGALGQLFSKEKQPVFIANRTRKIRNSPTLIHWFHVPGDLNPADCASRGISASTFLRHPLWLHGPPFLLTDEIPPQPYSQTVASFSVTVDPGLSFVNNQLTLLITSSSSFFKLKRLVGYWIRFITNLRKGTVKVSGPLTPKELDRALIPLVKCVQSSSFASEIEICEVQGSVKGNLRFLSPFLDKDGILRVGGRVQQSELSFGNRHPILLPKFHSRPTDSTQKTCGHFSLLVARQFHESNLHAAPKLLLSLIRSEFWILKGQNLCTRVFQRCIPCFKQNPTAATQFMGQLPSSRVTMDFPFIKVGLDYAGPMEIAMTPGRKPRIIKAWVCIFVCMATKAVHLEYSGGLSTPDFISAMQRFCAIRNSPSDIFCDGGTNFRGAKTDMEELQALLRSKDHQEKVSFFFAEEKVNFHFNPPVGPHHGGLWEAAVKSMKLHLRRIIQGHHISLEEFITLLARTSAALNSRPLTPLSNHPDDFEVITPFHFLTLRAPKFIVEQDVTSGKSPKTRWDHIQQMFQHLTRRWNQDYLQSLQVKHKWLKPRSNITKGSLVLLQDADSTFGHKPWLLGRIEETFPGKDGLVRACDVRIPTPGEANKKFKIFRRPVTRLSPLPMDDEVLSSFIAINT